MTSPLSFSYPPELTQAVRDHPCPLIFATISGAHLYGFPSPDSDWDLRGAHVLPLSEVVGLKTGRETIEKSRKDESIELDLVTHDVRKFFSLMLKKNGYVLEQLFSPLIVHTTPFHDELRELGRGCVTRHHFHHYVGFFHTQWKLFQNEAVAGKPCVKPLLYTYRVLLTGIHLMRTGVIEANLPVLNQEFKLPYIPDLIARKIHGAEKSVLSQSDLALHESETMRLLAMLEEAGAVSTLPDLPTTTEQMNDLLVRIRMANT